MTAAHRQPARLTLPFRFLQRALPVAMLVVLVGGLAQGVRVGLALGQPFPGFAMMWRSEIKMYTISYATPPHWPGLAAGLRLNDHIRCVGGYAPNGDLSGYSLQPQQGVRCTQEGKAYSQVFAETLARGQTGVDYLVERQGVQVNVQDVPLGRFSLRMMLELFLPFFLLGMGFLAVGLTVYRAGPATEINLVFAVFAVIMAGFMLDSFSPLRLTKRMDNATVLSMILVIPWLPLIGVVMVHLVNLLTAPGRLATITRRSLPFYYGLSLLVSVSSIVAFTIENRTINVPLNWLFLLYSSASSAFAVVWAVVCLAWTNRTAASERTRRQAGLIMLGLVLTFLALLPYILFFITDIPTPNLLQSSSYLGLAFAAAVAYVILRYQLFRSQARILTGLLVGIVCIWIANLVYLAIGQQVSFLPILAASLATGVVVGLRRGPAAFFNRLLQRESLDYQVVVGFSQQVGGLQKIEAIAQSTWETFNRDLDAESVDIWLIDEDHLVLEWLHNGQAGSPCPLPHDFAGNLAARPDPQRAAMALPVFGSLVSGLETAISVWAPLVDRGQAIGLLGLGPRWTGEMYDDKDLQLIGILARQMALAILNTRQLERLQATSQLVMQAEENERRKIARELHDTVLQFLLVLTYGLDDLKERQTAIAGELERWQERISAEAGQLRGLLNYLRAPELLVQQGLIHSLQTWLEGAQQETTMRIEVALEPEVEALLATEAKVAVYRTVREAVHNAARHSGGSRVMVRLWQEGDQAVFAVEDDGRGFDPARASQGGNKGYSSLLDMRLHMESVGGGVEVGSEAGRGTVVRGWAPLV
jgi:signal transduction histidine kinase